jgi:3-phenylpropionate/cinnamic acid dioxygenase small subunit
MESYLNNPFKPEGIVDRAFEPKEESKIWVDPETGESYSVTKIVTGKTELHDPMMYTKVYMSAFLHLNNLNYSAVKVFNYMVHTLKSNRDTVYLNCADVELNCKISQASYYTAIKALIEAKVIARKVGSTMEFWINPNILFNGNRTRLVKHS